MSNARAVSPKWAMIVAGEVLGGGGSTSRVFPDACIRGVGTRFPALSVEFFYLEVREVDAFEAADVDHVLRGVGSWSVERRHAAVAAEEMTGDAGSELIGREIFATGKHTKSLRSKEMMQVSLLAADRAVALGRTRRVGSDLESDSAAVTAAIVGLNRHQLLPFLGSRVFSLVRIRLAFERTCRG